MDHWTESPCDTHPKFGSLAMLFLHPPTLEVKPPYSATSKSQGHHLLDHQPHVFHGIQQVPLAISGGREGRRVK